MCHHGVGEACPIRKQLIGRDTESPGRSLDLASKPQHCHLKNIDEKQDVVSKPYTSIVAFSFSEAPCQSNTPKTSLPTYIKDFMIQSNASDFSLILTGLSLSFQSTIRLDPHSFEKIDPPRLSVPSI